MLVLRSTDVRISSPFARIRDRPAPTPIFSLMALRASNASGWCDGEPTTQERRVNALPLFCAYLRTAVRSQRYRRDFSPPRNAR